MIKLCEKHNYPLFQTVDGQWVCDKCLQELEELSSQKFYYSQLSNHNGSYLKNEGTPAFDTF
jgi:hypothetical protein